MALKYVFTAKVSSGSMKSCRFVNCDRILSATDDSSVWLSSLRFTSLSSESAAFSLRRGATIACRAASMLSWKQFIVEDLIKGKCNG